MFFRYFVESKPSGVDWVLQLPEDCFPVFKILLDIVHGNFQDVPTTLPPERVDNSEIPAEKFLYEMVVTADKYDMVHVLQPFAESWLYKVRERWQHTWSREVLWISWFLGDEKLLVSQLDQAVLGLYMYRTVESENDTFVTSDAYGTVLFIDELNSGTARLNQIFEILDVRGVSLKPTTTEFPVPD
jgi:hypothetical protein